MRLAFMGTPDFAVPALHALHAAGHEIVAVYTQPPRPAGRGQALRPSPVQLAAEALGIPVRCPTRLKRDEKAQAEFAALNLDAAIVAAYGLILPQAMLDAPTLGCLNIHASLLPRWRGASPIQSAILAGDTQSGVTIMRMEAGLDTGPMLLVESTPITGETTATTLHDALSEMGARLVLRTLAEQPEPITQPEEGVTYAARLTRDDGRIDWSKTAEVLDRQIRALTPWPGAFTHLGEDVIKIGAATPVSDAVTSSGAGTMPPGTAMPQPSAAATSANDPASAATMGSSITSFGTADAGTAIDDALTIACGEGALRLDRLQRPGRGMMAADAFLRGQKVPAGTRFGP